VRTGKCGKAGGLLLAGDALFDAGDFDAARPDCAVGLRFYQWMLKKDPAARLRNPQRLRELVGRTCGLF
jgi:hypothetical protein